MRKIINLCEIEGKALIIETVPINSSSFKTMDPGFRDDHGAYCDLLRHDYLDLIVNSEIGFYDDSLL